ncbi:hypothetical protein [Aliirhizobium smilacinae]|uniref:Addiction module protein n=1 Tax=Aliirhizobium smilacinae TaxID=1395944 RepID=A0A5C4XEB9_9HYPH|nr:hypothetical protein [Rhizobium smilacinae]TNM60764.1 hypothetical protein FHP24_23465 [Rhizobium smilacinae]
MTKLLDRAIERVRALPADQQDELAHVLLRLTDAEPVALSAGERAAIANSKSAAARGKFATDEEIRSV